jgi:threonine/homoserine/homoserine lactone efflux protein
MPPLGNYLAFLAAATLLMLTPGAAVMYVVTRGADQGRRAGLASVAGICLGDVVWVVAVVVGLAGALAVSPIAFNTVKYLGVGYLVYLGIRRLRQPAAELRDDASYTPVPTVQLVRDGALVSVLNPKDAIFFLALLPQFVERSQGAVALQLLVLGMTFVAVAAVVDGAYAFGGAELGRLLKKSAVARNAQRWVVGVIFLALAAFAATTSA